MTRRGGPIDGSQRWYEDEEGEAGGAGVRRGLAGVNIGGTGLVRCTLTMSVSSVAPESCKPNDLC
jgi:hypothetical protein